MQSIEITPKLYSLNKMPTNEMEKRRYIRCNLHADWQYVLPHCLPFIRSKVMLMNAYWIEFYFIFFLWSTPFLPKSVSHKLFKIMNRDRNEWTYSSTMRIQCHNMKESCRAKTQIK